jgi:ribosome-associated protein
MIEEEYYEDDEEELDESEFYAVRPNKTQIKKQIAAVSAMAEELSELTSSQIAEFSLPERVEQALLDAGKMGRNSARKRLLKYITAQLRLLDIDVVAEKLARMKNKSAHAVREHHQAERWRDQLIIDEGNQQLTLLMSDYPDADSQHLRQLQRNAQKEAKQGKPPKSSRLLYKYLKDLIADHAVMDSNEDFDDADADLDEDEDN